MDGLTWSLCLLAVVPALAVTGDHCQQPPWGATECCTAGDVLSGAEEGLSVECDSENSVHVQWSHSSLISPELIQLYSQCVNPTNTSQRSISTLLYNAHGIYLETSTTIPQLPNSVCTYFGCYVSNFAEHYYTFSEGSCTSPVAALTETLQMELQSTNKQKQTSIGPSISPSTTLGTIPEQTSSESSSVTLSTLPHPTPTSSLHGTPTRTLLWLMPLLLVFLLCTIATSVLMLIRRSCVQREKWKKKIPWHTQLAEPLDSKFEEFDRRSVYSEHTLYEDITCPQNNNMENVSDEPILLHHWCTEDSPGSSSATTTTDSGNASYITDGSLNYLISDQFKSQSSHDNSCCSIQTEEKTSNFEHLPQSNSGGAL